MYNNTRYLIILFITNNIESYMNALIFDREKYQLLIEAPGLHQDSIIVLVEEIAGAMDERGAGEIAQRIREFAFFVAVAPAYTTYYQLLDYLDRTLSEIKDGQSQFGTTLNVLRQVLLGLEQDVLTQGAGHSERQAASEADYKLHGTIQPDAMEVGVKRLSTAGEIANIIENDYFTMWNSDQQRWDIFKAIIGITRPAVMSFFSGDNVRTLGFERLLFGGSGGGAAVNRALENAIESGLAIFPSETTSNQLRAYWLLLNKPVNMTLARSEHLKVGDQFLFFSESPDGSGQMVLSNQVVAGVVGGIVRTQTGYQLRKDDLVLVNKRVDSHDTSLDADSSDSSLQS